MVELDHSGKINQFVQNTPDLEVLKLRSDYAWKWFSYHAGQRTSMFNYSLIVIGILANAYVAALKDTPGVAPAMLIAGFGAIMCGVFILLDCRNKLLVNVGEDALRFLEAKQLFTSSESRGEITASDIAKGILCRVKDMDDRGLSDALALAGRGFLKWLKDLPKAVLGGRHGVFLPLVELLFGVAFLVGAIYAPALHESARGDTKKLEVQVPGLREELKALVDKIQPAQVKAAKTGDQSGPRAKSKGGTPNTSTPKAKP